MNNLFHHRDVPKKSIGTKNPGMLRVLAACLCLDDFYTSLRGVCGKFRTRISTIIK